MRWRPAKPAATGYRATLLRPEHRRRRPGSGAPSHATPKTVSETRLLELQGITKRFDQVTALAGVDFDLLPGEVHTVLGENGAGKSTLMGILSGSIHPDSGTFLVDGEPVTFRSPRDGFAHGIGMVHQHYRLVRNLTAAENLHLGWDKTPLLANRRRLISRAQELVLRYQLGVDVSRRVLDISVGAQQRAELLR